MSLWISIFKLCTFINVHNLNNRLRMQCNCCIKEEPCEAPARLHPNNQFIVSISNLNSSIYIKIIHFLVAINRRHINHFDTTDSKAIHHGSIGRKILYIRNRQVGRNFFNSTTSLIKSTLGGIISFFSKIVYMSITVMMSTSIFNISLCIGIGCTNAICSMENVVVSSCIKGSIHTNRTAHDSISTITTSKIASHIDWTTKEVTVIL